MTEQERIEQLKRSGITVQKLHEFRYNLSIANVTGTGETFDTALLDFVHNLVVQNGNMHKRIDLLQRVCKALNVLA